MTDWASGLVEEHAPHTKDDSHSGRGSGGSKDVAGSKMAVSVAYDVAVRSVCPWLALMGAVVCGNQHVCEAQMRTQGLSA